MDDAARFTSAPARAGMYESFYLRAVDPAAPVGLWARYTVRKAPGEAPVGSVWCTVFDGALGAPYTHKVSTPDPAAPPGRWIRIDSHGALSPREASGECGAAWSLEMRASSPSLSHLSPSILYRLPLPRTKPTSPAPSALFTGRLQVPGRPAIDLDGWRGMVGHNWGAEHAERWIWIHGVCFEEEPSAWIDVVLGRVIVGGRLTPWAASGAIEIRGRRTRLGGLLSRATSVDERADGCVLTLSGGDLRVEVRAAVPAGTAAGWRYSDPDGSGHDVVNCSIAALEVDVRRGAGERRRLHSAHGGAYELGMREGGHGVPLAPFPDG